MLDSIRNFFEQNLAPREDGNEENAVNKLDLASAALLVEVMNCDHQMDERETDAITSVLKSCLSISDQELAEIIALAKDEAKQATSLYDFTRLINDGYDYDQKIGLIRNMWRVAFADGELDKYEDYLIRKIAELIYVTHSDFIRTKLEVKNALDASAV